MSDIEGWEDALRQRDAAWARIAQLEAQLTYAGVHALTVRKEALEAALTKWSGIGRLETFGDRERFRKEVAALLGSSAETPTTDADGRCARCGCEFEDPKELTHECPPGFTAETACTCGAPPGMPHMDTCRSKYSALETKVESGK